MAVEPKTKQDRDKMSEGLQRLAEEDPTFRCFTNEETGQLLIAGMGELHLEIICDRLRREFKVEANTGAPQIAYRETITAEAEGEGKFVRQSGGRGQYGHACIKVYPNEKGKGVEVENKIVGGAIPKEYIPAVIDGIEEAIKSGVYAGYQVIDIKVQVTDGSFHEVDSNELAFKMAGIFALKDAFKKAKPILLEPIMKVECTTPDEYQGDLLGDINRRRGIIQGVDAKAGQTILNAHVPLAAPSPPVTFRSVDVVDEGHAGFDAAANAKSAVSTDADPVTAHTSTATASSRLDIAPPCSSRRRIRFPGRLALAPVPGETVP